MDSAPLLFLLQLFVYSIHYIVQYTETDILFELLFNFSKYNTLYVTL